MPLKVSTEMFILDPIKRSEPLINIDDVGMTELVTHADERGFFREIMRSTALQELSIGQISYSKVLQGIIKAWHGHAYQTQWTFCMHGVLQVGLHDYRKQSRTYGQTMTFRAGSECSPVLYKFPPGVLHGYRCISGPATVLYITSGQYDIEDEVRVSEDEAEINFQWASTSGSE